jgi:hypothetical protein
MNEKHLSSKRRGQALKEIMIPFKKDNGIEWSEKFRF